MYSCCSVTNFMSNSLQLLGLQCARFPCPSLSPRVCSNSCPLSWWCYLSHPLPPSSPFPSIFPASGSFPMSWLFASGGQSIRASASASVLPVCIQGWFPLGLTGLISLLSKRLSSLLQHHNSKASVLQSSAFFMVPLSHLYMTTGKTIELSRFCKHSVSNPWDSLTGCRSTPRLLTLPSALQGH